MDIKRAVSGKKGERGAELVEFALVLLPLLSLVFLIVCVAWIIFAKATLQHAVREGCRFAVTNQTDAAIKQRVQQNAVGVPQLTTDEISVKYYAPTDLTDPVTSNAGGNVVEVTVSGVTVNPLVPAWPGLTAVTLSASASDIMEFHQ